MADQEVSYILRAKDAYSAIHKGADKTVDKTAKNLVKATGIMTAAVGGVSASLLIMSKTTADSGDEFHKMSARLGISSQALSEMKHAAELSGASINDIELGIKKMSKTALDADRGLISAKRSFDELGISVKDSNGNLKNSEQLFTEVSEGLKNVKNETERTALAQELLGRSGLTLLPLIKSGAEGLNEMREEARNLGITFSDFEANQSAAFIDASLRIQSSAIGMKNTLSKDLIPFLTVGMDTIADSFMELKKSGDLDKWSAEMATGVITSFSEIAKFAIQLPAAFNATMVGIKEMTAGAVAGLQALTVPLQNYYEMWTELTGGEEGFLGSDAKRKAENLKNFNSVLEDTAVELLISSEANKTAGNEAAIWALKQEAAIDRVRTKMEESVIVSAIAPTAEAVSPAAQAATGAADVYGPDFEEFKTHLEQKKLAHDQWQEEMKIAAATGDLQAQHQLELDAITIKNQMLLEMAWQQGASETEIAAINSEARQRIAEEEMNFRLSLTSQTLSNMGSISNAFFELSGKKNKEAFKVMQAVKIAETGVNTYSAAMGAYNAMASIPYIGPALGIAAAAAAIASGAKQVKQIKKMKPGGSVSGGGGVGGGAVSAGGGAPPGGTAPGSLAGVEAPEDRRTQQQVIINVKALDPSEINWDKYSENIVDTINRAGKERDVKIEFEAVATT